ncbi:MAG: hypothetical protein COW18_11975 [Zetaproteobacteria bacterium CG12_big_fil_rev_8_21_14_0_65_54_13]|nr:MAG: hypothetical protein COX55_05475 [Zetaproteobacteria bacterium CG23_combo_of_CG06-09_8_20_14_all_54_7]PIW45159.1 MAG: hypothetical protein COW18_11975 [Zetaproteobacteria bacterium CG12_big_fil_rev_8_21_14_0_65_54_13]PIX55609.1 MAG: hypothetical protein COZ50_01745 [Zetaproteobacteria bacterium CG_4_10_14_3_um_filter_54_28]PJA27735.1 MAG: hypothetical protein CO188_11395 [Zetaproteobacteria bacterium CG_4_9_14_3_um_filter_54_145]
MSIETIWQNDGCGLHRQYIGELSMCDVLEATLALQDHPRFNDLRYIIEDYTGATNTPFEPGEVRDFTGIIRLRSNTKSPLNVAIISRNSPTSVATANAFCEYMLQCHYRCRVFLSPADALAWATAY